MPEKGYDQSIKHQEETDGSAKNSTTKKEMLTHLQKPVD